MKVKFLNRSSFIDMSIDKVKGFKANKIYDDIVFGWFNDTHAFISKEDYNKILKDDE